MDEPVSYYISLAAVLLALLGLNMFFSLCETGFSSLSRIKLKNMAAHSRAKQKGKRARLARRATLALKMLNAYDKLLSSILIGNTIVNITASALAAALFISLFGARGLSLGTAALTLVVLLFCEIAPKTLAKESPELTALRAAPLLRFFTVIFTPLSYLAAVWQKIIGKMFPAKDGRAFTEDELLTFVEEVRQEGGINKNEEQMIRQVIEFDDITAAQIVTPRIDLAAVSQDCPSEEIDRVFAETGFSRLPVYSGNIDTISGVILLKDFHHEVINKGRAPAEIVKPVVYVTKTMKISALLKTLQRKQAHIAVLVDEFGGTLGIVSIEDIIEELVGEIWDEHEKVVEEFKQNDDGSFTVLGSARFHDIIEYMNNLGASGISPNDEDIPATTVGNWILETAGRLPGAGEQFNWQGLEITVSKVQRQRVIEAAIKSYHE